MQPKDYNASFLGKRLLEYAFKAAGYPFSWEKIVYSAKDRPYLESSPVDFNISHSGAYVVVAIGSGRIGIDIEQHRRVRLELFNRQFTAEEWIQIRSARDPQQQFFRFWSIKEAAIKADGRGVEVLSDTAITTEDRLQIGEIPWYYQPLPVAQGYSAAVCCDRPFYVTDKDMYSVPMDILLEK